MSWSLAQLQVKRFGSKPVNRHRNDEKFVSCHIPAQTGDAALHAGGDLENPSAPLCRILKTLKMGRPAACHASLVRVWVCVCLRSREDDQRNPNKGSDMGGNATSASSRINFSAQPTSSRASVKKTSASSSDLNLQQSPRSLTPEL